MDDCVKKYKIRRDARLQARKSDCFREDYGVKGMKWGEHTAQEETTQGGGKSVGLSKSNPSLYGKYEKALRNAEEKSNGNPNNVTYSEMKQNYGAMLKSSEDFNPNSKEQSGMHAAMKLESSNIGDVVEIKGNIFEGKYQLQSVKSIFSGERVPAWVALDKKNHNHSFVNNTSTIMSELGMVKGGKWVDDKGKSITVGGESAEKKSIGSGRKTADKYSSGKYTKQQLQNEYKKLIDEKGGMDKITNKDYEEARKKLGATSEEWNNAKQYWYVGPGSKKMKK